MLKICVILFDHLSYNIKLGAKSVFFLFFSQDMHKNTSIKSGFYGNIEIKYKLSNKPITMTKSFEVTPLVPQNSLNLPHRLK